MEQTLGKECRQLILKVFHKPIHEQREKLNQFFLDNFDLTKDKICLDVGGITSGFEKLNEISNPIAVNLRIRNKIQGWSYIRADARYLPLKNRSIDFVVSNATLEHIKKGREKAIRQMKRVSKGNVFVSVPYFYSPLEPHYLVPFFQFVPNFIKKVIILDLGIKVGWIGKENYNDQGTFKGTEFKALFPEARVYKLKIFFFAVSLIALMKEEDVFS